MLISIPLDTSLLSCILFTQLYHNTPPWSLLSLAVSSQNPLLAPPLPSTAKYMGMPKNQHLDRISSLSTIIPLWRPPSPKALSTIHVPMTPKVQYGSQHHQPHASVCPIYFRTGRLLLNVLQATLLVWIMQKEDPVQGLKCNPRAVVVREKDMRHEDNMKHFLTGYLRMNFRETQQVAQQTFLPYTWRGYKEGE